MSKRSGLSAIQGVAQVMVVLWGAAAQAEPTLELRLSGPGEIFPGDPESASVDAAGRISLGLNSARLGSELSGAVISLASDGRATYAGTAGGGLYEIDAAGKAKRLLPTDKAVVSALAFHQGHLFAATSPDGLILSLDGSGKPKTLVDPSPKYLWALLSDPGGLLAATGEPGSVIQVSEGGKIKVLFDPGETHVRALTRHPTRGLVAGGGQRGIVYQLKPGGGAFALYDSGMEEVTAFASDAQSGDLYASFVSESKPGSLSPDHMIGAVAQEGDTESPIKGSEVVRITKNGRVDLLWSSRSEGALGLSWDDQNRRLLVAAGTGPKGRGRIYAIDTKNRDRLSLLARVEPSLASAIQLGPTPGSFLVGTAPSGQLIRLGPGPRSESSWTSSEQDLHRISRIGRLWFDAELPAGAELKLSARTGNTRLHDKTWSDWSGVITTPEGGPVSVPEGRYAQLRVQLRVSSKGPAPVVKSLHASVVRMNVAPTVQEVFLLRRGVYLKPMPKEEEREKTVSVSASQIQRLRQEPERENDEVRVRQGIQPGMATAAWRAEDRNGDELLYRVEIRRVESSAEGPWLRLADNLETSFFSFDSRAYADGHYQLRVTASDRPANPPSEALSDQNQSDPFAIDNGPPKVLSLSAASPGAGRIKIEAEVEDSTSPLGQAEVSLDGGPWLMLPAADGLVDSKREKFVLELKSDEGPGESKFGRGHHTLLMRVEDDAANSSTASATVEVQ